MLKGKSFSNWQSNREVFILIGYPHWGEFLNSFKTITVTTQEILLKLQQSRDCSSLDVCSRCSLRGEQYTALLVIWWAWPFLHEDDWALRIPTTDKDLPGQRPRLISWCLPLKNNVWKQTGSNRKWQNRHVILNLSKKSIYISKEMDF